MKNTELLIQNIEEGLSFIRKQQEELRPLIDKLTKILLKKLPEADITFKEAIQYYNMLMEQETNSILVISKMQEILTYKEF